jgi:hypothetical protein
MQKGPSLTLRVVKNLAKRRPDRFKATISATSKLTLRVTEGPRYFTSRRFQQSASASSLFNFGGECRKIVSLVAATFGTIVRH